MPDFSASRAPKAHLRSAFLAARRARPAGQRAQADALLVAALARHVRRLSATKITGYVPLPDEPGGPGLADALAAAVLPGLLLLPLLLPDGDLDWAVYDGELRFAGRGLREPTGPPLGRSAVATVDVVITPALAVDRRGIRLGRGGGSYDRALARVPATTPMIAVLYDGELVDELPDEPHDRRVDAVVTPADGVLVLPAGRGLAGRSPVE